jgi:hypothetical protein
MSSVSTLSRALAERRAVVPRDGLDDLDVDAAPHRDSFARARARVAALVVVTARISAAVGWSVFSKRCPPSKPRAPDVRGGEGDARTCPRR